MARRFAQHPKEGDDSIKDEADEKAAWAYAREKHEREKQNDAANDLNGARQSSGPNCPKSVVLGLLGPEGVTGDEIGFVLGHASYRVRCLAVSPQDGAIRSACDADLCGALGL